MQTEMHFLAVKVSLKDGWASKNDDNRMPTLCVLPVILKSKKWIIILAVWAQVDLFAGLAACVRSCIGGQRCDYTDA